jgi:hypothetical protein
MYEGILEPILPELFLLILSFNPVLKSHLHPSPQLILLVHCCCNSNRSLKCNCTASLLDCATLRYESARLDARIVRLFGPTWWEERSIIRTDFMRGSPDSSAQLDGRNGLLFGPTLWEKRPAIRSNLLGRVRPFDPTCWEECPTLWTDLIKSVRLFGPAWWEDRPNLFSRWFYIWRF